MVVKICFLRLLGNLLTLSESSSFSFSHEPKHGVFEGICFCLITDEREVELRSSPKFLLKLKSSRLVSLQSVNFLAFVSIEQHFLPSPFHKKRLHNGIQAHQRYGLFLLRQLIANYALIIASTVQWIILFK